MDDEGVVEQCGELLGTLAVFLDEGDAHLVLEGHGSIAADAGNHGVADADGVFAHGAVDAVELVGAADDVGEVAAAEDGVAVGYEGVAVAEERHDAHLEFGVGLGEFLDIVADDG